MSDTPGHTTPSLSPEFIARTREIIAQVERDHPNSAAHQAYAARLRHDLEAAIAAIGQPPAVVDSRSPAARLHDQRFGISYVEGRMALPAVLGALVERDAADKIDGAAVARQLEQLGYKDTVEAAKDVLRQTGSTVKPEQLGVHALRQLEIYGEHLKRHAASRPK
jgi:hypothetical protein